MTRIAVVGGGRIGEALVSGLLGADWKVRDLVIAEKLATRARQLTNDYGIRVTESLGDAVEGSDVVVIAVKPGDVDAMLTEFAEIQEDSDDDQLLVSLVAGIPTAKMENLLQAGTAVVRVMPNTPMLVGKGASAMCAGRHATPDQLDLVEKMLDAVGMVRRVKESQMDAVTAVSGSGPAYAFLAVEAMVDSGVALGLTRTVATDLAVQTLVGASAMLTVFVVASIVVGPLMGEFTARHPLRRSWLVLAVIGANAGVWAVVLSLPGQAPRWLLVLLVVVLAAGGPGSVVGFDYARTSNPHANLGLAQGMVNQGGFLASLLVLAAVGGVVGAQGGYSAEAFRVAWLVQYPVWAFAVTAILITRGKARRYEQVRPRPLREVFSTRGGWRRSR